MEVGLKAIEHWRSVVHDQWNVVGIMGGLGYGLDGMPYITSHYGYYMSSWHIIMALSGQKANMTKHSLTFEPKLHPPFILPVILPGVWGYLQASIAGKNMTQVYYSLGLHFGSLELEYLAVHECVKTHSTKFIDFSTIPVWTC